MLLKFISKNRVCGKFFSVLSMAVIVSACSSLPSSGPSVAQVVTQEKSLSPITVVELNDAVARRVLAARQIGSFAQTFPNKAPQGYRVGAGDVLEVSVWEAPPAVLFTTAITGDLRTGRQVALPEQVVNKNGIINVPFAGAVPVVGKTLQQIETTIARRLSGKANQPQVLVRVIRNTTQNVTVVGEVTTSTRMPLTAKGERLLDAVAAAGGVRQPVDKITMQLARAGKVVAMPLENVIQDPSQNIYLLPGDVVTALFQPLSFTSLGAAGKNEEVNFEAKGITLAQALGRIAGVRDNQANAHGVFIFRYEDSEALEEATPLSLTAEGKIPVVYRVDLKDPRAFLVAQNFPIKNKDVLYVANAPSTELQKFLNIISSLLLPVHSVRNIGL